jgi:hypothetical protein
MLVIPMERSAALQLSSPPRSEMYASISSLHRRTHTERPSIQSFLAFVTEDRCGSFCWTTWRRSEGEFATISITSARFLAAFLAPKVQYFRSPQPGAEGMFRVGKTKVQTTAKKLVRGLAMSG